MTFAEQFGLDRSGTCWCCGGLGLVTDDWDAVERCVACDSTGSQPLRQPVTDADLDEGVVALMQIIDDLRAMEARDNDTDDQHQS